MNCLSRAVCAAVVSCTAWNAAAQTAVPPSVTIDIHLADSASRCTVVAPKPNDSTGIPFNVDVEPGQTIIWRIQNRCGADMEIGVGNFRAPVRYLAEAPRPYPLDEQLMAVKTVVMAGQTGTITAHMRTDLARAMTWLYDVLAFSGTTYTVIADPEIEIPR